MAWTLSDMPDQSGRVAIVTGANSGLGYHAARALAAAGAHVILACRSEERGREARERIETTHGGTVEARVELRVLDLADLSSIEAFATGVLRDHASVDLLVNNAGVMAIPLRRTADRFEMQLGTNHLGHYALTMRLMEPLLAADAARVVTVSSLAHKFGRMRWKDPNWERSYSKWLAYGQSKLANLLFTLELDRRLQAHQSAAIAVACHPGYADTNLQSVGPELTGSKAAGWLSGLGNRIFAQDASAGALPILYAATHPDIEGGDFVGPSGILSMRGAPALEEPSPHARDAQDAARLWALSAELTSITPPL